MIRLHATRGCLTHPLVSLAVLLLAGCTAPTAGPSVTATAATPTATAAASVSAAPTLTIGILVPFTESAISSEVGVAQQRAARLYLTQHGGKIGGRETKLVYSDESVTGALDLTKAAQLVEQEHAELILGLVNDDGAYAVRGYADQHHVVFVDTSASGNALTRATPGCTPACASRYVFRSSFTNAQLSEPLGEWAAANGHTRFFAVYADDAFGSQSAAAFGAGLAAKGGRLTGQDTVAPGSDWAKVIATIARQPMKDVYAAFTGADAIGFVSAWADAGMAEAGYHLFGPGPLTGVDVLTALKERADGITTSSFWASTLDNAANLSFEALFAKTHQDEQGKPVAADASAVEMWDTMTALDMAMAASGGATGDALVRALEQVRAAGARGPFRFDQATHNVVEDIYIRVARTSGGTTENDVIDTLRAVADPGA